jgi:hypothetical protein
MIFSSVVSLATQLTVLTGMRPDDVHPTSTTGACVIHFPWCDFISKENRYESIRSFRRLARFSAVARQPTFIDRPGVDKSAVVGQLAEAIDMRLQDLRALSLDPVDLLGLPFLGHDGRSKWATPEFFPQDGTGILFLDELNALPAMVQASCFQLLLDRKLGEYTLREGWAIIAAGNRDSDRGATTRLPTPLRNRFVHLEFEVDVQGWSEWAIQAGIRPEVIAFLRFRPELLSAFDRDANAFPSPRSWEFVSRILVALDSHVDPSIEHEMIAGAVEIGAAIEVSALGCACSENCPTSRPSYSILFKNPSRRTRRRNMRPLRRWPDAPPTQTSIESAYT